MAKKTRRSFTPEKRANAVAAYAACENYAQVARDLGIHASVLRTWVKQAEIDGGSGPAGALKTDERAELAQLRRENRKLAQERDFLKKAAAFFARDDDQRTR